MTGDAPRDDARPLVDPTIILALRPAPFALSVGEFAAEERLEMRGIFVGVSLESAADVLRAAIGGPSFASLTTGCKPPTEGEPAIVGSCVWRRREVSDCFCIELTVCEVAREPALTLPPFDDANDDDDDVLRLATRCAVDGGNAEICIGGMATGSLFLGCG